VHRRFARQSGAPTLRPTIRRTDASPDNPAHRPFARQSGASTLRPTIRCTDASPDNPAHRRFALPMS
jgi:hypothetical protein